jgi:hypothetical protein
MRIIISILCFLIVTFELNSQCTCIGGAAVGGLTPIGGSANIGVLKNQNIRISLFDRYGEGDEYFSGDAITTKNIVENYSYNFMGLNAGYGITDDLTVEVDLGYFVNKMQQYEDSKIESSGFSHLNVSLKYNLFAKRADELEYTIGLGGRIPLNFSDDNVPQNILPSTGAYGLILHSFLHKGFKKDGWHFVLLNRAEINSKNNYDYSYGFSLISSLYTTKVIFDNFITSLEIRNEYRDKDKSFGKTVYDSGGFVFIASPQLSYKIDNFYLTALFDYPFYKYYYGKQLTNAYSLGLMLTWQSDFLK